MLGEGMDVTGYLQLEPMQRTIEGLELFREITDSESIKHILPIATSAVREAKNSDQFLLQVLQETGFAFRMLSEKEEALYSYAGAFRAISEPNVLFFDLGGGSLELVQTANFAIRKIASLPLGALRLSQLFSNKRGTFSKKDYFKLREHILELLPPREELKQPTTTALVGVGGTIRALASIDQEMKEYPLEKVHRYTLSKASVESIESELLDLKVKEIAKLDYIGAERAKTLTAGTTVISTLMEFYDLNELIVSTRGLRDGVLAAYLENPRDYYAGTDAAGLTKLVRFHHTSPLEYSKNLLTTLVATKQLTSKEETIVVTAASHILRGLPPYRPFVLFHILMDEDANMDHQSQLIMALSIVRTLRAKTAEWLYERYKSIAEPAEKNGLKKITALLKLVVLLEKTGSRAKARHHAGQLEIAVYTSAKGKLFPVELLKLATAGVSEEIGLPIKLYGQEPGNREPPLIRSE